VSTTRWAAGRVVGAVAVAVALVAGGCGGGDDGDDGGAATTAPPEPTVVLDADDGSVRVADEDGGSFESDADGNLSGSGTDGDYRITYGDAIELPPSWPDGVEVPAGSELIVSTVDERPDPPFFSLNGEVLGDGAAVRQGFVDQLEAAGFTITSAEPDTTGFVGPVTATRGDEELQVTVGGGDGLVTWTVSNQAAAG
jgi:hypothetical protein